MRIACGGFMHETNTFVPAVTPWEKFNEHGAWPGFQRGPTVLTAFWKTNIALTGFMEAAEQAGHAILPLSWSFAQPSGRVDDRVFERAVSYLLADIADAAPDAVFLELHGAMTTETIEDAEGELLARVRRLVGPDMLVVASLDLHANVTQKMVDNASFMSAYRTYPHIDWRETGVRVTLWLDRIQNKIVFISVYHSLVYRNIYYCCCGWVDMKRRLVSICPRLALGLLDQQIRRLKD